VGLVDIFKKHLGTKKMKIEAIQFDIQEHLDYIKLYENKVQYIRLEIKHLEAELEKLKWQNR